MLCGFIEHLIIALKVQGKNIKTTSGWAGVSQGKGYNVESAAKRKHRSLSQVGEERGDGDRGWVEGRRRLRPEGAECAWGTEMEHPGASMVCVSLNSSFHH